MLLILDSRKHTGEAEEQKYNQTDPKKNNECFHFKTKNDACVHLLKLIFYQIKLVLECNLDWVVLQW